MFEEMNTQFTNKEQMLKETNHKLLTSKEKYKAANRNLEKKHKELLLENDRLQIEVDKLNGYNEDLLGETERLENEMTKTLEAMDIYKRQLQDKPGGQ